MQGQRPDTVSQDSPTPADSSYSSSCMHSMLRPVEVQRLSFVVSLLHHCLHHKFQHRDAQQGIIWCMRILLKFLIM